MAEKGVLIQCDCLREIEGLSDPNIVSKGLTGILTFSRK
jgi:hypothetical protein